MYETRLQKIGSHNGKGAEIRRPIIEATAVVEQRVSHFLMGLALIGTMTGPLLTVLATMPRAVFGGVFFIVGVSCICVPFFAILYHSPAAKGILIVTDFYENSGVL